MGRYVAKKTWWPRVVADRLEIQISYVIGKAAPLSVSVETFDTNKIRMKPS